MKLLVTAISFLFSANALAMNCRGTEPGWIAKISDGEIVLEGQGYPAPKTLSVNSVSSAEGSSVDLLAIYSNNNGPVAAMKTIECNDGMSDDNFPKEIIIFTGTAVLHGCCGDALSSEN